MTREATDAERAWSAPLSSEEIAYRESLRERIRLLNHKGQLARQRMLESA